MKPPLRRFAPPCVRRRRPLFGRVQACAGRLGAAALSPSLDSLREAGWGRPQRGGAALARGRWPRACQFQKRSTAHDAMDH